MRPKAGPRRKEANRFRRYQIPGSRSSEQRRLEVFAAPAPPQWLGTFEPEGSVPGCWDRL